MQRTIAGIPKPVLIRSLKVSAIVGTILNLINQPEALFGDAPLVLWKVLLTYSVPFLVATYGAMTALAAQNQEAKPDP
ncbi:MAG: nitrate/nitrite transporter NrtS [Pseudomonadota bacterium]